MAIFDSIVHSAKDRAGLSGDKAGGLVAALLRLISDPGSGGFGGFIDRFRSAGLGSLVDSWIRRGDNAPISNEQVESALGSDTIARVANEAGVDRGQATSAIAGVLPALVDNLTPDGEIPDEKSLLSRVDGFLSDWGGTIGSTVAGGTAHDVAGATDRKGKEVIGGGIDAAGGDGNALDVDTSSGSGFLKWLFPLLLLGLAIVLGYMFCGKGSMPAGNVNANTTANRPAADANANADR